MWGSPVLLFLLAPIVFKPPQPQLTLIPALIPPLPGNQARDKIFAGSSSTGSGRMCIRGLHLTESESLLAAQLLAMAIGYVWLWPYGYAYEAWSLAIHMFMHQHDSYRASVRLCQGVQEKACKAVPGCPGECQGVQEKAQSGSEPSD